MTPRLASLVTPLLRRLDAETAHGLALRPWPPGWPGGTRPAEPILATEALGLRFANPIGLAAGFDKDAVAVLPLMRWASASSRPAPSPRGRSPAIPARGCSGWRRTGAVINRMGFNNGGHGRARGPPAAAPRRCRRRSGPISA